MFHNESYQIKIPYVYCHAKIFGHLMGSNQIIDLLALYKIIVRS